MRSLFRNSPFDALPDSSKGAAPSRRLALYREHAKGHFAALPESLTLEEVEGLLELHRERLAAEREERRMHFGAFALVGLVLFILLPGLIESGFSNPPLSLLALLLIGLIVPYSVVYFGYENRVRAMTLGLLRLMEAQARLHEQRGG